MAWFWIAGILVAAAVCVRLYMMPNANQYRPDMTGRYAIVVGATAGIGVEMARILAQLGAKVIITGRDKVRAAKVVEMLNKEKNDRGDDVLPVEFYECDLADLSQVKEFANKMKSKIPQLDILVNNAATVPSTLQRTKQGLEMTMGTNYISLFYMTSQLFPLIKKSKEARVVNVAAGLYVMASKIWSKLPDGSNNYEDILLDKLEEKDYSNIPAYGKSKLGNILFAKSLARKMEEAGLNHIKTASHHPGVIKTELTRDFNPVLIAIGNIIMPIFCVSPWYGAQTAMVQACCPADKIFNGGYYSDCKPVALNSLGKDAKLEDQYWNTAVRRIKEITGDDAFGGEFK